MRLGALGLWRFTARTQALRVTGGILDALNTRTRLRDGARDQHANGCGAEKKIGPHVCLLRLLVILCES
jgi:hypothetical protein